MSIQMEAQTNGILAYPTPVVAERSTADRTLPAFTPESSMVRWIWLGVAAIVIAIYGWRTFHYWAPADGGVDQNAYLLGGRMMAEHFSTRYTLPSPYAYVGGMMMRSSNFDVPGGDYYPKYPLGLPLLYACFFWIFGATHAATLAFLVSPISSILAVTGMFFLARLLAGSFAGLMAAILLGCSQLMIELSNNPNSHASCVAFIVWGMFVLLRWWQTGGIWRGVLAGFLIGYACLIRYSEGLLILPVAIACISRLRWSNWKSYFRCAIPGLAWAVPVVLLLIYNKHSMGHWTGYDSTNESEGFTWVKFKETWEQMLRTYYDTAAFFILPLGLAGIFIAFNRSWQLGLMLLAWLLPGSALYTAYYWSPDSGVSYARFFLTFLPVVMVGAAICFSDAILLPVREAPWYFKIPRAATVVLLTAIAAGVGVYRSVHGLQEGHGGGRGGAGGMTTLAEQSRVRQNLAAIGKVLLQYVPANSVIVADSSGGVGPNERPLNYIQFLRHWDTYSSDAFTRSAPRGGRPNAGVNGGANGGANGAQANPDLNAAVPTTKQKLQEEYLAWLYPDVEGKTDPKKPSGPKSPDGWKEKANVINSALKEGRGVFALATIDSDGDIKRFFNIAGRYQISTVQVWSDLPPLPVDPVSENAGSTNGRRPGGAGNFGGGGGGGRRGNGGGLLGGFAGGRRPNNDNAAATTAEPATKWELLEIKSAS